MSPAATPMVQIQAAKRLVVKVGTGLLTTQDFQLDEERIRLLSDDLTRLIRGGRQAILVSSGAVGAGMGILGWSQRPRDLARSQAAAAVGQGRLMQVYSAAFGRHGIHVAQILLTREDFAQRRRYLNALQTIRTLWREGVLPVVNENDTVSTEEIRFGDNDELSAGVANLADAEALVILSDVDGFERRSPGGQRELVPLIERITPEMERWAGGASRPASTGGMVSKLHAARTATAGGIPMILANGTRPGILSSLFLEGRLSGTLFLPSGRGKMASRKRWLAFTRRPRGSLVVDAGARQALLAQGRSLLASGVRSVSGSFRRSELVSIRDPGGQEFARGLVNYPSAEMERIQGLRSEAIAALLGRKAEEVVHRDHLVLLE